MERPKSTDSDRRGRRFFLQQSLGLGAWFGLNRLGLRPVAPKQGPGLLSGAAARVPAAAEADYQIRISNGLVEVAPQRFLSTTLYNGQFPGPLLRFREGEPVTVDVYNDTDTPEQLHWHGQFLSDTVDGASEEGTPFIAPHGQRRETFVPGPAGFRFYHTHVRAGSNLHRGQYTAQVGPLYIEPREPVFGSYDREVFLTLKEFEPFFQQGGDMAMDMLHGGPRRELQSIQERAERAHPGRPPGYEVGYRIFTVNGRQLGHGAPIRVRSGERILFHILNGSATEIRSLALPGHLFRVLALDGNPVPRPQEVPVLWLGTAERITALVEMNHPGVWVMGDLADEDRARGMGTVLAYEGHSGPPRWETPAPYRWDYRIFAHPVAPAKVPDAMLDMVFAKDQAADKGFNRWTINGQAFDMNHPRPLFELQRGKRYRLRMRNGSDDIHPMHLHRHSFELSRIDAQPCSGLLKDVVMLGGFQELEVDFTADQPGLSLFHCHMQLHMDFGFMALLKCS